MDLLCWICITFFLSSVRGEFTLDVRIPKYIQKGSNTFLECLYSVPTGALYSVKWYKEDSQFYQFIPGKQNPKSYFNVSDVNVDVRLSNEGSVYLRNLTLESSGRYRCEVITEAPAFHTKFGYANMTVFVPPSSAPIFTGLQPSYELGSEINVNCSSPSSKPSASLQWFINGRIVVEPYWLIQYPISYDKNGLETSVLGLQFIAMRSHFESGSLKLKCKAQIGNVYFQSVENAALRTSLLQQKHQHTHSYISTIFYSSAEENQIQTLVISFVLGLDWLL